MGALDGKVVIVTGSTSGIGRATALAAAGAGAAVVVTGRRGDEADQVVANIRSAKGRAIPVVADITEPTSAGELVASATAEFGGLHGVVNAAGIIVRATAEQTDDDAWRRQMAVNVDGPFYVSRAAVPAIRASGGGAIVNVSSTCGKVGAAGLAGYCASKGAVISLTQAMALEHASEGIRVNAVCPGSIDTPMLAGGHPEGVTFDDVWDANLAEIPQARIPQADEVADLIVFLLSDTSRHITGTDISIDGGYTAR